MQIIQSIRSKAAIAIVVIALCLIGFILMDAKQGSNNLLNSGPSSTLGKVNGSPIDKNEFFKRVEQQQLQQEQQMQGNKLSNTQINQIRDQVWNLMVDEKIFYAEADKLGIDFTTKELSAILSAKDQNNPILREITNDNGEIDDVKRREVLNTIRKSKGAQRDMIEAQIINPQRLSSISTKYYALLSASAYYPSWMEAADVKDAKAFANISYVAIPYNVISDSTIKVTDAEIEKYVQQHKEKFKQEEGRMVSYVAFSQLPNAADSARARDMAEALKNEFGSIPESAMKAFVGRNTAGAGYDSGYKSKTMLGTAYADSIVKMPVNAVFGPYVDVNNGSYSLARILGSRMAPDSARARHILIPTINPQTGEPVMADSVAKKRADSIYAAIKGGADFAALALQYSSDGSKEKGGDLGTFPYGQMVPEFNDYSFYQPAGSMGVVKTQFGYHVINVLSQKGSSPVYKVAFVSKEIVPSETTINNASLEATKAAAEKTAAKLDAYLKKNGIQKVNVPDLVKENDYAIAQLQDARDAVRWIYSADKGEVSEPFSLSDQYVIFMVDKIYKKGTQDVQTARPLAEGAVREEKKAAEIIKKLGANPTLESAAAAYNQQVLVAGADSSLIFNSNQVSGIGPEPKVIGASFCTAFQTKVSPPIAGKAGVYVLKVNSIGNKPADTPEAAAAIRSEKLNSLRSQVTSGWYDGLKEKASIKDNRSKSF